MEQWQYNLSIDAVESPQGPIWLSLSFGRSNVPAIFINALAIVFSYTFCNIIQCSEVLTSLQSDHLCPSKHYLLQDLWLICSDLPLH